MKRRRTAPARAPRHRRAAALAAAVSSLHWGEGLLSLAVLSGMAVLPLFEVISRFTPVPKLAGSQTIVQHLTLWLTFFGAALAARGDRLLALSTASLLPAWLQARCRIFSSGLGAGVTATLAWAAWRFVQFEREGGGTVGFGVPSWIVELVMPVGFAVIAMRMLRRASPNWSGRAMAAAGLLLPLALAYAPEIEFPNLLMVSTTVILAATVLGMPLFAALGGLALVLFWWNGEPIAAVPLSTYQLSSSPLLPAVPLFTLGGYILAEGGACGRFVRVFRALVGWMPGGLAVVTAVVFAFFTSFTGASGVTILSLGGLLFPVLVKSKYPKRFSYGLVTASGSIGLLFPPSLPVILYGVRSATRIDHLFIAGFLPGILLVALIAAWGVRQGVITGAGRYPFRLGEALAAVREAIWELLLPVIVFLGIIMGYMTLVETAALTVLYALFVEAVVYRDLSPTRGLARVVAECSALIGGVLLILGSAMGFTNYLIDAGIPDLLLEWVRSHVDSRLAFLLALNVFLLLVGCLMDIYSAILVVVPLIVPIATAYGVHPVHLGVIFLANLELGYLTPPVGMNLFLSAYRFNRPVGEIIRSTVPFLLILLVGVLLITYLPVLSLGLLELVKGG